MIFASYPPETGEWWLWQIGWVPWLVNDERVLASAERADSTGARVRGLLKRDGVDGVLVIAPAKGVHTMGMRFPIDIAYCRVEAEVYEVLEVVTMEPNRVGRPRLRANAVIETEAGNFERWGVSPGDVLEFRS